MKTKYLKKAYLLLAAELFFFPPRSVAAEESHRDTPVVRVIHECASSVVNISTERIFLVRSNPLWRFYGNMFDEFHDEFGTSNIGTMKLNSLGSGVVVSDDGLVMTNAHVVNMASKVFVILNTGEHLEATVVAAKPQDDLALLRVSPARKLKHIKVAKNVMIGETVVAVGNPLGLENSVSSGIVSGVNRKFMVNGRADQVLAGLIQTDASINFGSSGGALLNLDGELVGINLAVAQNAQGIGFAVPFSSIMSVLDEYASGKLQPPDPPVEEVINVPGKDAKPQRVQDAEGEKAIVIKIPVKNKQ